MYEDQPLVWLADHTQAPVRWTWLLLLILVSVWTICALASGVAMFEFAVLFLLIYCSNGVLKLWIAWLATHRLADDRRSGALEMLCCLPVPERSIWGSWLLHLKQRLFAPVACLILAEAFLLFAGQQINGATFSEKVCAWGVFVVMTVFLVADGYTLSWTGISFGLNSVNAGRALAKTIAYVLLGPGLLIAIMMPGWSSTLPIETIAGLTTAWACWGIMLNIPLCAVAIASLSHSFRDRIARSDARGWDGRQAWRALSPAGRRRPIPSPEMLAGSVR